MDEEYYNRRATAFDLAMERFKEEQKWYQKERELLEQEDKHNIQMKLLMKRAGRL
jgi:hypothetical protein